jgi:hypothetical protein
MSLFNFKKIPVKNLTVSPELNPKHDEILIYLWQQAITGAVPVYFAAVPFDLIEPFDKEYNPRKHPVGQQVIAAETEAWKRNQFRPVWVYPREGMYILSDDYMVYYAAVAVKPDFLPCLILGNLENDRIKNIQGPVDKAEIAGLIGI